MRKKIFAFFVYIFILLNVFVFFNQAVLAQSDEVPESMLRDGIDRSASASGLKPEEGKDIALPVLIGQFLKGAMVLLGLLFLILVIYAGITWMTAAGAEQTVTKAQKTMINAAIGLVVTLLAYQLTSFVISNISVVSAPAVAPPPASDVPPNPAAVQ